MIATARETLDAVLDEFYVEQSLSPQDKAILDYARDGWPLWGVSQDSTARPPVLSTAAKGS